MAIQEFRCKDHPEANSRKPIQGEQGFTLIFPLENGDSLHVLCGRESMNCFETFLAQMMYDDAVAGGR